MLQSSTHPALVCACAVICDSPALRRLAKYVPEMRGDSGEVRASAETWATLERGVRGLSKALGESKKRLGTIAAVMKNVSDLQGSLEAGEGAAAHISPQQPSCHAEIIQASRRY